MFVTLKYWLIITESWLFAILQTFAWKYGGKTMPQVRISYNLDLSKDSTWLTVTTAPAARSSIPYVQELGDFRCGPDYYTSRENLPSYLIKLCISGEALLDYDDQHYTLRPGQIFWIDCNKPQYYRTAPGHGQCHLLWVHFYGSPCDAYYKLFLAQNEGKNVVQPSSDMAIRSTLDSLMKLYHDGGNTLNDDVQASAMLTQLMSHCIHAAGSRNGADRLPAYVIDARSYINSHYAERITLDDLSRSISINKFYLQKLFKRCIGLSPNEYLIHTRLTRAKQLLRNSSHPISQIAMDVGISNIGHFISLFKRYEGITPSAYRQRWYISDGDLNAPEEE